MCSFQHCSPALSLLFLPLLFVQGILGQGGKQEEIPSLPYGYSVDFTVAIGNRLTGTITLALFKDYVPITVANFAQLAHGGVLWQNKPVKFQGSIIHRIVRGFVIQGGDITSQDGTGGISIYGDQFPDENFNIKHYGSGWLSMANSGKDTNNSQFFITLRRTGELDGKHVVFGKVVRGMDVVRAIEKVQTDSNERPIAPVRIVSSKLNVLEKPYPTTTLQGAD